MKIAVFGPSRRVGVVQDDEVVDISGAYAKYLAEVTGVTRPRAKAVAEVPGELNAFIEEGARSLDGARLALEYLLSEAQDGFGVDGESLRHRLGEVRLHAPVALESRIFCALANFRDHMENGVRNVEANAELQAQFKRLLESGPKHFPKHARCLSADGEPVRYPARTRRLDYEAEVAVVIGKRGRDIRSGDFAPYIWGYTLLNDWSVRDHPSVGPDFGYTKNFDTSATVGPWIVVDEGIDPQNIPFELRVNGEVRQSGNTGSMIFDFAAMGEYLSADTTLYPGDLISGGTPKGTAADSSPMRADGTQDDALFVRPGDVVELTSSLIGTVRNHVIKPD